MATPRPPSPYLQELTEFNREALAYYKKAREILVGIPCSCKPEDMEKRHKDVIRSRMGEADDRLAAEVRRVYEYRRKNGR